MGTVESAQNEEAVSHAGARGLYQILPSTGRRLARDMGLEFDTELLHDPHFNTLVATRYLEQLIADHDDLRLALAEYNGGPHNAARFKSKSSRLAEETRSYVPKVIEHYERILQGVRTEPLQSSAREIESEEALRGSPKSPTIGLQTESPLNGFAPDGRTEGIASKDERRRDGMNER
jgi:hypothetical protein